MGFPPRDNFFGQSFFFFPSCAFFWFLLLFSQLTFVFFWSFLAIYFFLTTPDPKFFLKTPTYPPTYVQDQLLQNLPSFWDQKLVLDFGFSLDQDLNFINLNLQSLRSVICMKREGPSGLTKRRSRSLKVSLLLFCFWLCATQETTSYKLVVRCCYHFFFGGFFFLGAMQLCKEENDNAQHIVVFVQFASEEEEEEDDDNTQHIFFFLVAVQFATTYLPL